MNQILNELNSLIQSEERFTVKHVYSSEEIESFENRYDLTLPREYKEFLMEIGSFKYEYGDFGSSFNFLNLEDIESWSHEVFPKSENKFPEILLIANSTSGEELGFIKGKNKLYVFNPECPSNLWLEDQMEEYEFQEWLGLLYESKMETIW